MFIISLIFDVRPDKRGEFASTIGDILNTLRSSRGASAAFSPPIGKTKTCL
jgi:hypothetical protein